jgi:hypothetical protein
MKLIKKLWPLVWLLAIAHAPSAQANDAPIDLSTLQQRVEQALWYGDLSEVERLVARARQSRERTRDGVPPMTLVVEGLAYVGNRGSTTAAYFAHWVAYTHAWAAQQPNSVLAQVMHAQALTSQAWYERGGGYSNTVTPEASRAFVDGVQAAAAQLRRSAAVASTDALWHLRWVGLGNTLGWTPEQIMAAGRRALDVEPGLHVAYYRVLENVLPKWGGSAADVDRWIREAVRRTEGELGLELYARLYADASYSQFKADLFSDSRAQWPLMKQGFEQMLARWPGPMPRNQYAYFACLARDRTAYLAAMTALDDAGFEPDAQHWGSLGQRSVEGCKRWGAQG